MTSRFLACVVLGVLFLGLFSCSATTLTQLTSKIAMVEDPPIGAPRVAEIGDTLVRYAKVAQSPALYLKSELRAKGTGMLAGGHHLTLRAGFLVARYADATKDCYMSIQPVAATDLMGGAYTAQEAGLCVDRRNPDKLTVLLIFPNGVNAVCNPVGPIEVEKTTYVDKSAPGFSQELIYNGKSGQTVKFLYREFSSQLARPAFDQEIQYDLNESHVIGFKGARLEVVQATNMNITYKVLAHFPRQQ